MDSSEIIISSIDSQNDVSPHAPDPSELWPPFGLLGSKTAIEALGPLFSSISDSDKLQSDTCLQQFVSKQIVLPIEVKAKGETLNFNSEACLTNSTKMKDTALEKQQSKLKTGLKSLSEQHSTLCSTFGSKFNQWNDGRKISLNNDEENV